jgi:hypothetical protein
MTPTAEIKRLLRFAILACKKMKQQHAIGKNLHALYGFENTRDVSLYKAFDEAAELIKLIDHMDSKLDLLAKIWLERVKHE